MITLPLFYHMLTKSEWLTIPIFLLIPALANCWLGTVSSSNALIGKLVYFSMEYFLWITPTLMGLCFARYGLFEKLGRLFSKFGKLERLVCIVLMLVLVYFRAYKEDTIDAIFSFDCFYAPIFVFLAVKILEVIPGVPRLLKAMGAYSMNIWFLHSLFFFRTAELMKYIYAPRISLLILLWTIVLCLPFAWMLSKVSGFILGGKTGKSKRGLETKIAQKEDQQPEKVLVVRETTK